MSRDAVGGVIDDSDLFHYSKGYDPEKARAYYLANRKLKGRPRGGSKPSSTVARRPGRDAAIVGGGGKPNRSKTKSRQAELRAQQEALRVRLDRLREVLEGLVEDAKKRSGGDPNKKDDKDKAPETQVDKADRNKAEKKDKPETAAQKKERAKKAKEAYEKEHPNTLSQNVDILREQVADIQEKIQAALADARERRNKAGKNDSKSGSQNSNDGPRGR